MKINMSEWITENSNILSYDDVVAKERYIGSIVLQKVTREILEHELSVWLLTELIRCHKAYI